MPDAGPPGPGLERFKIARGAVTNMGPVIGLLLGAVLTWLFGASFVLRALGLLHLVPVAMPVGALALVAAAVVYLNLPGAVAVGADGVMIDWRDRKRYVPLGELDAVAPYREQVLTKSFVGVTLRLRSGEDVKLPVGEDLFGASERVARLASRITAARDGFRRRDAAEPAWMLERGPRTAVEWHRQLRGLGAGTTAGPRDASFDADRLWRIVEDPTAGATARAGAAVALQASLDADGRTRLRVAAEATVAPRLRVALESVVAGDDEAVVAALAEVADAAATR